MRPDNWEYGAWLKDERFLRNPPVIVEERLYNAFEAGADAMLEGLNKLDVYIKLDDDGRLLIDPGFSCKEWTKGKLVFIPEEEEKDENRNLKT